ncbi:GntR family transcriptional regulator [Streptomyces anulatus]|uniref:GntR family transcriptional regulator n=1 Tax=Streptomyces anulatus TaxID=1892 RepID=UPI002DDA5652|nr:GntR family transcriptional regulator [Streptomyces anulatus]WSC60698.1 GntR family transcriptional regulator [Streptomyces anulatus]WSI76813.1 GntR family transcriptional regulator [Streptomyces anulatus]
MPDSPSGPHAPYMTVLDALAAEIKAGKIKPGEKIPSEADLVQRFGVARMTARRAVGVLRERGLVRTEWGKGTFVVATRPTSDDERKGD